jgi:hypothetical protein
VQGLRPSPFALFTEDRGRRASRKLDALEAVHLFAVGGHEIAQVGLHEVDASSAKDTVEGPRPGVADLVIAEAAEEEIASRSAYD